MEMKTILGVLMQSLGVILLTFGMYNFPPMIDDIFMKILFIVITLFVAILLLLFGARMTLQS